MRKLIHLKRIRPFMRITLRTIPWASLAGLCGLAFACSPAQSKLPEQLAVYPSHSAWVTLFAGRDLNGWESTSFGGEGEVEFKDGEILLPMGSPLTGVRAKQPLPITIGYELEVEVSREMGNDFFCGLTFPVRESFATIILGGWGGGLCGLSCVNAEDASSNSTTSFHSFEYHKKYRLRVRVGEEQIVAWVDDEELFALGTLGNHFSLRTEMLPTAPLGISSFITTAAVHSVRWRPL